MSDRKIRCIECQKEFTFAERDQRYYADRGYQEPRRCAKCREINKLRLEERKRA